MTAQEMADLLKRGMGLVLDAELSGRLARYLDLLVRWNARTNLTGVRSEEEIVLRHFGESLQCAYALPPDVRTLLDYGSGAGFPGMVCALIRPEMEVLLAESQGKKASFLREACRQIPARAKVHAGRVEALAAERRFDAVVMRAVDRMERAMPEAIKRVRHEGWLVLMTTRAGLEQGSMRIEQVRWVEPTSLRGTEQGVIAKGQVFHQ